MANTSQDNSLIHSFIGEGAYFSGDMNLQSGLLRIDGDFEGNIRTRGRILVGKSGRAKCIIEADTVIIGGIVKGNIRAHNKVVLLSTCLVIGSITTPRILVEEGVLFHGRCIVTEDNTILESAASNNDSKFSVNWGA